MDKAKIDRINELAKKKKQEGLTFEETAQQNELRRQYIDEFKNSLRQQIESIKIIDDDGKALTAKQYNEQQKKKKQQSGAHLPLLHFSNREKKSWSGFPVSLQKMGLEYPIFNFLQGSWVELSA